MPKFHARVHPILARKANTAVIIRRGPSKSVCTMLWDRSNDTFKLGQWLRGRIYERRCDLSPDGKHFIYFAMNGKWGGPVKGSWTAISRAPYLKALALWPWGDCWNGGGLFLTDSRFWLNNHWYDEATETIGRLGKELVQEPGYPFDENYGAGAPVCISFASSVMGGSSCDLNPCRPTTGSPSLRRRCRRANPYSLAKFLAIEYLSRIERDRRPESSRAQAGTSMPWDTSSRTRPVMRSGMSGMAANSGLARISRSMAAGVSPAAASSSRRRMFSSIWPS